MNLKNDSNRKKVVNQQHYWDEMSKFGANAAVIDPADVRGYKNEYIARLRDAAILSALEQEKKSEILDFGCGSGNLSEVLSEHGYTVSGIDVSKKLLEFSRQRQGKYTWGIYHYDGNALPFENESMDAIVTYTVLNHLVDDDVFNRTMSELYRILKPGGQIVAVEQITRKGIIWHNGSKKQRRLDDFITKFIQSGLHVQSHKTIRRGHFPLLYAIRYGFFPRSLYKAATKIELAIGSVIKKPIFDYADVIFSLKK